MTHTLPLLLALACASDPTPAPDAAVNDAGDLHGEWLVVGCNDGGTDRSPRFKGWRIEFAGASAYMLDDAGGGGLLGSVRADPTAHPRRIDVTAPEGVLHRTAYLRAGDALFWAWGRVDGPPPSSFDPAPGVNLWTLRRVRK
jgi:uncharacterized protein (TIGR03067 family)